MKIVVVSDNHKNYMVLEKILNDNPDADNYLHLGDSEFDMLDIRPFAGVRGNVDDDYDYPIEKVIDLPNGHSIYMCHGNAYSGDATLIAKAAKDMGCDIALFGHTHIFYNQVINGISVINPGSCSRSKEGPNSYAIINIGESIDVYRIDLD